MKLLDVNIWVALSVDTHEFHPSAKSWFDEQNETSSLCFCRATQLGYLRLLTTSAVLKGYGYLPYTNSQAWNAYDALLADQRIGFKTEPEGVDEIWQSLAARNTASPKLWMDAYLAAFAIRSGLQLVTADKAFSQFNGLDFHLILNS